MSLATVVAIFCGSTQVFADVHVSGYFRKDGTYVQPHFRSDPDGNFSNNFSTYGNMNPYTGELGTKRFPQYNSYSSNTFPSFLYSYVGDNVYDPEDDTGYDNDYSTDDDIGYDDQEDTTLTEGYSVPAATEEINEIDPESYISGLESSDELKVKKVIVQYLNEINSRNYKGAYNLWDKHWKSQHSYQEFEDGYIDVINFIDFLDTSSTDQGVTAHLQLSTLEGWDETEHSYDITYSVKKVDGQWKIIHGKIKKTE
ncbi:hypothetical protein [Fictibacillus terranigra]|uniref:Uncharacterized protein n=1 Tax=Fictibacillus terranigra TaxID=3058424 RepID=A0ABT8E605_9BACL|nr:hypothetical protein [Fictibacillus sp. CENA-BCM004]MDN4073338.1 hypothetical protein [Fictibacillus sp. CENA-BCM004]